MLPMTESTMAEAKDIQKRRRFSGDEKAKILKRHLSDRVPISDLCDEHGIQPSVVYGWLKIAMENLASAFDGGTKAASRQGKDAALMREVEALRARVAKKDSVIADISEEYVVLKKSLGVP
jgi:transposase